MSDLAQIKRFVLDYNRYALDVLRPNEIELRRILYSWRDPEHWASHATGQLTIPSVVHRTEVRVKRTESVADKIRRRREEYPDGLALKSAQRMIDAVAGRVIVFFLSHLPYVDKELRESPIFEVSSADPPRAHLIPEFADAFGLKHFRMMPKASGYSSLHYTVRFRSHVLDEIPTPWFEIQVRTLVEHAWGEIEHVLGYKPKKRTSLEVAGQFRIIARELTAIDEHFDLLYNELARFQHEGKVQDTDLLNAENLPPLLSQMDIKSIQIEVGGMLKVLASSGFGTVGEFRGIASDANLKTIRNIYQQRFKRSPTAFEAVAAIAAIKNVAASRIMDAVRTQIDTFEAWHSTRESLDQAVAPRQIKKAAQTMNKAARKKQSKKVRPRSA